MTLNLLIIFIKNPVEGDVKTRLGASIGSGNALLVYKKLLTHTREVAVRVDCERQVWYSSMVDRRDDWDAEQFSKKLQKGSGLGERMSAAFMEGFDAGYKKIVIIGSDCAGLAPHHINRAFKALDDKDAVIGPSQDGGYYLLGLTKFRKEIFSDIAWSTPEVFDETVKIFGQHQLEYSTLETLNDIDTIEDLKQSSLTLP